VLGLFDLTRGMREPIAERHALIEKVKGSYAYANNHYAGYGPATVE
jgi:hypothetical protein